MAINIGIPTGIDPQLFQVLVEICRRALDGTVNGDIRIIGGGNGLILPCRNGTSFGRVILENPDANGNIVISVDPI